ETRGPLTDTLVTRNGFGRVYVCRNCVGRHAILHGLVTGEKNEELVHASKRLAAKERQLAGLQKRFDRQRPILETVSGDSTALHDRLDTAEGRVRQLEQRLRDGAHADLELVDGAQVA